MKMETERDAKVFGEQILKILGTKWRLRVWENIGWHCAWQFGSISIYYDEYGNYYYTFVGEPWAIGGHIDLCDCKNDKDPKKAARNACKAAQKVFQEQWQPIEASVAVVLNSL